MAVQAADFDFDLPPERIAHQPTRPRDAARLLVVGAALDHRQVSDLPDLLRPGDVLVANDTRVIPAQLTARRGDARVGITLDQPTPDGAWHALARNARRLRRGDVLVFDGGRDPSAADPTGPDPTDPDPTGPDPTGPDLTARDPIPRALTAIVERRDPDGGIILRFDRDAQDFSDALVRAGVLALPPYIDRPDGPTADDQADYQTIFARQPGAVAAPTAGLHFTRALLDRLDRRGIHRVNVTLHVGAGTFLPVRAADVSAHRMHAERGEITAAAAARINAARAAGGRIVAVGTTSLRLLESAADPDGTIRPCHGETSLFILPGYRFRAVDILMTNFHLPRSTLFMLVCAFAGTARMRHAYARAIAMGYRFYSYGDASLLCRDDA